jgi:hypothetical protein
MQQLEDEDAISKLELVGAQSTMCIMLLNSFCNDEDPRYLCFCNVQIGAHITVKECSFILFIKTMLQLPHQSSEMVFEGKPPHKLQEQRHGANSNYTPN